jgi:L-histidine N-alpha-methyltransferase
MTRSDPFRSTAAVGAVGDDPIVRMAAEVRAGLLSRPLPTLPSKYFYDDRGSALFEDITRLPEYYQTRTEEALLEAVADRVIAAASPRELLELGSGVGRKIRLLLDAMRREGLLERCLLLDINERMLEESVARLEADYPGLEARGLVGDFTEDLSVLGPGGDRLVLFLAGTIGNLHPDEVPGFLASVARQMARGDGFLVGLDLVKDEARLHAAYNDAAGVTAEFNRNILCAINHQIGADFDPQAFAHVAFYDRKRQWIEMRLRAVRPTRVTIPAAGLVLDYEPGDEIRTEISAKYTRESFAAKLPGTALRIRDFFTDPERLFALALLERTGETPGR